MNKPMINIEQVVRDVLAALKAEGGGPKTECEGRGARDEGRGMGGSPPIELGSGTSAADGKSSIGNHQSSIRDSQSPIPNPQSLVVTSRVVTMTEVSGRLDSARRLVVSREAVVTPAVRDELLRRGIALEYADSSNGHSASPVRLAMVTMGTDFDPTALAAGLAREGMKVEHSALDCLVSAADQLAAEVAKPNTLGVLLTRHTAAGLCLANRLRGVRAISGADAPAVATAAAAVGANVLVADPQAGTFFQLKQMVTEFGRCGVRPCPATFLARLA